MAADEIGLTIEGEAGQDFQIWYRGDRETGEAPIVQTGKLGADGRLTVRVPRAYLLLGKPVRAEGVPLDLQQEAGTSRTVQLPKPGNDTPTPGARLTRAPEVPVDVSCVADLAEDGCNASILFSDLVLAPCRATPGGAGMGNEARVATKAVTFRVPYSSARSRTRMVVQTMGSFNIGRAARVRLILCAGDVTVAVVDKAVVDKGGEAGGFDSQTMFAVETHAADPVCQITLILVAECDRDGDTGAELNVNALWLFPDCDGNTHLFQEGGAESSQERLQ